MPFKIATASVEVVPDDSRFEDDLRAAIAAASEGVRAEVGLRLNQDAPISLDEDVRAALDMVTEGVKAQVGLGLKDDAVEALDADVKAGVELVEADTKIKVSVDPKSAQDTEEGISGLIVGAVTAGAAVGAPALLAGLGAAFVGVTAIALAQTDVVRQDYQNIGNEAVGALVKAVQPLAPTMHASLLSVESDIKGLQPTLDGLFANAGPDITSFTSGVENLVGGALPGMSQALGDSQVIAQDFGTSLGTLGSGVGTFFTGLTRDSTTTGQGLSDVVSIASNALGTLGNIAGSASSAISADLMAVTPAINGVLTGINKLSSPATIGALGGGFAAFKLGGPISSGLQSASDGLLNVAVKAEGAGGVLGKLSGAASGSSLGLSKMADVMGGPWGIAIGAGVGLVSGLVGSMLSAASATKAVTLSQQDLAQALSEDGDTAGKATAAYVATQESASGLASTASAAGVSTSTWTQAVLGNKKAHDQVIDSIDKANLAQQKQTLSTDEATQSTGRFGDSEQARTVNAQKATVASNDLTTANQKLVDSLNAQTKEVADSIAAQTKYEQALDAVDDSEQLFNASLTAAHEKLVATAQAQAITTVGSLALGSANYGLTSSLNSVLTKYSEASAEGSAYESVLDALSGTTNSLLSSEAQFTIALSGVTAAAKANGTSLDVNNAKGAQNIQTLTGIATSADKAAVAVYQSEVNTKGASQAYDDANKKLATQKAAFEAAAEKAGFNKQQVQALADELFKLPKDVPVGVDVKPALSGLQTLLSTINKSGATVHVYENSSGDVISQGTTVKAHAGGGFAPGGEMAIFGEEGPELGIPTRDMQIIPAAQTRAILSGAAAAGARATGAGGVVSGSPTFIFNGSQYPTVEQMAQLNMAYAGYLGGL